MKLTLPKGLHIRPSRASDNVFLARLHHSIRQDLQLIDGEKDFIENIVEMQFKAQAQGYGEQFPNAMYFIIEKHREPIGKATLDFGSNEIRLVEIAFLPAARGHGFGKAIMQSFQACAAQVASPLVLTVEQGNNGAKQLYKTLGFQTETVHPPYEQMAWYPPSQRVFAGA